MKLRFIVFELYNYFDSQFYNLPKVKEKSINNQVITDFLINVHIDYNLQSINEQFIFKYLIYQYDYWKGKDNSGFGNHTRLINIFGQKAYNRFKKNSKNFKFNWYNAELNLKKSYGIDKGILHRYRSDHKKDVNKLHIDEENEKSRFKESSMQLIHCIDNTTLFNKNSHYCLACKANVKCKILLKQYYRDIHRRRTI